MSKAIETINKSMEKMSNLELAQVIEQENCSKELATRFAVGDTDDEKYARAMVSLKTLCREFYKFSSDVTDTEVNKTKVYQRVKAQVALLCPNKSVRAKRPAKDWKVSEAFLALQTKATDEGQQKEFEELCRQFCN